MKFCIRWLGLVLLLTMFGGTGCSRVAVPLLVNPTPTPPPTQVPLPTRVAVAAPTPTLNLIPPGDTSEATAMLKDFFTALAKGDVDGALTYWNTSQSSAYAANVRKIVQEWIDQKRRLALVEITYLGRDSAGKSVPMPVTDPRVEQAIAKVMIDNIEYQFYLVQLKGGWFIEGVNTFGK
ncbi:MAG: hypothetical protein L0Y55_02565 [Anaerolineales bacterium]|nr:hypothetical protein [Anaerolineales bacterium]